MVVCGGAFATDFSAKITNGRLKRVAYVKLPTETSAEPGPANHAVVAAGSA